MREERDRVSEGGEGQGSVREESEVSEGGEGDRGQ